MNVRPRAVQVSIDINKLRAPTCGARKYVNAMTIAVTGATGRLGRLFNLCSPLGRAPIPVADVIRAASTATGHRLNKRLLARRPAPQRVQLNRWPLNAVRQRQTNLELISPDL